MNLNRLTDRLNRLNPGITSRANDTPSYQETNDSKEPLEQLCSWKIVSTPYGACRTIREELDAPVNISGEEIGVWFGDQRLDDFDINDALFLDIESTGLSHGAGTMAFLIGLAYVENNQLIFEQLFLDDPSNEMAMLSHFIDLLESRRFLVSFNGKSFDLSILQNRLVVTRLMSRIEAELKVRPHLDLLHASRQAYRGIYENNRLQTMEKYVLKLPEASRLNDVPGHMVPTLYFHYLHTSEAQPLLGVLAHNRTDVLSMVTLTTHLLSLINSPVETLPASVAANLGRTALRRKLHSRAMPLLEYAANACTGQERYDILLDLITASRRHGNYEVAISAAVRALEIAPAEYPNERDRLLRQVKRYERKVCKSH